MRLSLMKAAHGALASAFSRKSGSPPSYSAHVRWCEHGAPVQSGDARCLGLGVGSLGVRAVESHISRKTSEMWGTRVRC
jgi:hypothetical protein